MYRYEILSRRFVDRLARFMRAKHLTQTAMAKELGVTKQAISWFFADGTNLRMKSMVELSDLAGVDIYTLLAESPEPINQAIAEAAEEYALQKRLAARKAKREKQEQTGGRA